MKTVIPRFASLSRCGRSGPVGVSSTSTRTRSRILVLVVSVVDDHSDVVRVLSGLGSTSTVLVMPFEEHYVQVVGSLRSTRIIRVQMPVGHVRVDHESVEEFVETSHGVCHHTPPFCPASDVAPPQQM